VRRPPAARLRARAPAHLVPSATDGPRTAFWRARFFCRAVNYNNGGQDWATTVALGSPAICSAGKNQSPINIADAVVTYGSLPALNISYGKATSWMLENTGARWLACALPSALRSR
jgi:hypothetical protein